jgi:hypothetical protein
MKAYKWFARLENGELVSGGTYGIRSVSWNTRARPWVTDAPRLDNPTKLHTCSAGVFHAYSNKKDTSWDQQHGRYTIMGYRRNPKNEHFRVIYCELWEVQLGGVIVRGHRKVGATKIRLIRRLKRRNMP